MLDHWKKIYDKSRQHIEKQRCYLANNFPSSQSYGFSSSHMELDHKECWALKNWCCWTVVLQKTLESHLDSKEVKPVNLKWNQSWIFIGGADAETEAPILCPPEAKSRLIRRLWCWERLRAGGEGWDGWMALLTQWTWVWVDSGSWWWRGRPGMLRFMGSQRVRHDRGTELT